MGRDLALAFAREGADVVLTARTEERLNQVAAEVRALGRRALCVCGSVDDEADRARIVAAAEQEFGSIDVLVNNAFQQPPFETLEATPLDTIRAGLEINLLAALGMTQRVAPLMRKCGGGAIVMVNSAILRQPLATMGAYKMAKHGLLGMAQALAVELGPDGIRVNSVAPWYIQGESVQAHFRAAAEANGTTAAAIEAGIASQAALRRLPASDEISDVVVFLASWLSRAVTGQCIDVNCGAFYN
jgi:NAD(P)-dependent dehydrogenase (short-subunit alcohol dehydrogenase family)